MFHKPAEGPFDNPAFAQHLEADLVLEAGHDLQPQGASLAMPGDPPGQLFSAVALVGPQTAQPPEASQRGGQQAAGSLSFGHVGWGDTEGQEQPQRVHQDMTFDAFGFLGRVVASLAGLVGGADGLGVQDSGGGLAAFASLVSDQAPKHPMNGLPIALLAPEPEVMIDRLPRSKVPGQQPPGAAGPDQVKQGVADAAQIGRRTTWSPPCFARRQRRLQQVPLFVTQISRIQTILHPASLATPLGQILSIHLKMIFQTRS